MSFWSRFLKKDLKTIELLQKDLDSIMGKTSSEFMGIVGLMGKIKGLDLVSSISDSCKYDHKQVKGIYAKMIEAYLRFKNLNFNPGNNLSLQYMSFEYNMGASFCVIPFSNRDDVAIVTLTQNIQKIQKKMDNISDLLKKLEEDRGD
ncbi:MAG: hypothetical protein GF364_08170 [Candidatus Lokiarchaeota archaeon]|nr:hypothetical protein [Candidatus Lokiarchaeota archaeon]